MTQFRFEGPLPDAARAAVGIVRRLATAGWCALLAGGAVRDLLSNIEPLDYDVATSAHPDQVVQLFPQARKVGVQFGVVLVRNQGRWVEVATFRTDFDYLDGRRPSRVTFGDAQQDAARRDFTINGMFLDPLANVVHDYVGGREDLAAGLVRAIGDPYERFAEDHLRLLRGVRLAARMGFEIEPATAQAMRILADRVARVAPERVREELSRMLEAPSRLRAFDELVALGLFAAALPGLDWTPQHLANARIHLAGLPPESAFESAFATLLLDRTAEQVEQLCRRLTFSNQQREVVHWLVSHHADLDAPGALSLAELKRLLAGPIFPGLHAIAQTRYARMPDAAARAAVLAERLAAVRPDSVRPAPYITGLDLAERGIAPGPVYKHVLDELYEMQLNELLGSREEAMRQLDRLTQPASEKRD